MKGIIKEYLDSQARIDPCFKEKYDETQLDKWNDQIQIRGLRIMEGENGMFVGYPIDTFYKGEDYRTVLLPITRQLREHIESCVLEKYHASIA